MDNSKRGTSYGPGVLLVCDVRWMRNSVVGVLTLLVVPVPVSVPLRVPDE